MRTTTEKLADQYDEDADALELEAKDCPTVKDRGDLLTEAWILRKKANRLRLAQGLTSLMGGAVG